MKEIYKDVVGFEGMYLVSNLGNVKSFERNIIRKDGKPYHIKEEFMSQNNNGRGYLFTRLYVDGKGINKYIHRLVAEAFIPNPENLPEVNHKSENKYDNSVENLEWATHKDNCNYGTRTQRSAENHSKPINQYDLHGNFIKSWNSATEIERVLNLSSSNISKCCRDVTKTAYGFIWRYVNEEVA